MPRNPSPYPMITSRMQDIEDVRNGRKPAGILGDRGRALLSSYGCRPLQEVRLFSPAVLVYARSGNVRTRLRDFLNTRLQS